MIYHTAQLVQRRTMHFVIGRKHSPTVAIFAQLVWGPRYAHAHCAVSEVPRVWRAQTRCPHQLQRNRGCLHLVPLTAVPLVQTRAPTGRLGQGHLVMVLQARPQTPQQRPRHLL